MNDGNAPADNALPSGTQLGEFQILSVVAEGGFGIVYRARDHSLQRDVALKEYMPAALARRDGTAVMERGDAQRRHFDVGLKSFVNEARLLATFDHPALVKVYRFWEANGTAYMVMPLLSGESLRTVRLRMTAPPDEAWLRALLGPLLSALAALHAEKVIHRDVAPDNITILADDRPVLLDFGAARHQLSGLADALTTVLKPAYAPVEQYVNDDHGALRQGPWTDLYALGGTVHFLLTGRAPPPAAARMVGTAAPLLAALSRPGLSQQFLDCVEWMLQPAIADRPQSVAAVRERLFGPKGPDPLDAMFGLESPSGAAPVRATDAFGSAPPAAALAPAPESVAPQSAPGLLGRLAGLFDWFDRPAPAAPRAPPAPAVPRAEATQIFDARAMPGGAALPAAEGTVMLPVGLPPGTERRGFTLTVLRCDVAAFVGHAHLLAEGETLLGRESTQLRIPDPRLSARHARLELGSEGPQISDLGSTNGTWVNGVRLASQQPVRLQLGATVQVGSTLLTLARAGAMPMPELKGRVIDGRYHLRACLHTSPKGVVYAARKEPAGLDVVVKILSPDYAAEPAYRERFAAEARIAAGLQHPHICRLDDFGETDLPVAGAAQRVPYAAFPSLAGGSLAERVGEFATLGLDTIERWVLHAADALAYAHERGVVHGNLKPSALCFDAQSNLYLTDFAGSAGVSLFGTPGFTAPEQWAGEPPTPTADQYALAAIAYHVLTGARVAQQAADPAQRDEAFATPPPSAHLEAQRRFKRTLAPAVTQVLNRALAAQPAARHAGVAEFARELAAALRRGHAQPQRHVFISYRRDDSAILATYIAERLEQRHEISAFVDVQGLDGATRFPARIERAIADCEVFVCILGAGTLQSAHVRREIALAAGMGKPMIPVFQESYTPPDDATLEAVVADLLLFDGIPLLDKRNIYVHAAVDELARQVRTTIERNARR